MKRVVFLLSLLSCLSASFQARANPANCDGDMTPDQTEMLEYVVGLHPILFGGPIAIMRTCEQVKKFLSTLSSLGVSKRTPSMSDEQVRSALESTHASPGSASSCLLKFDANACRRYFGFGDAAPTVAEIPAAPAKPAMTLARAKIKRDELLLKDRELANNLVPLCKSIMSAQACEARLLAIESLRDEVARWNKDPELMAFIPPITIDSPDLIAQTGWERGVGGGGWTNRAGNKAEREICPELTQLINGLVVNAPERAQERLQEFRSTCAERDPSYAAWLQRWEGQLARLPTKGGSKGGAYVRPEDCERLGRQINADLRARPRDEPPSLGFFEVECASDTSGKYAEQVIFWKQAIASRKATEALNQWDSGIRQKEAEQTKAREEEERRVAALKRAEEERQRVAEQRKRTEEEAEARRQASTASYDNVSNSSKASGASLERKPGNARQQLNNDSDPVIRASLGMLSATRSGEHAIEPAKMYAHKGLNLAEGNTGWVIATNTDEAAKVASNYGYDYLAGDITHGRTQDYIVLDFGWFAFIDSYIESNEYPGNLSRHGAKRVWAYAGRSREEAINTAIREYERVRGNAVAQFVYSGLVAKIDWRGRGRQDCTICRPDMLYRSLCSLGGKRDDSGSFPINRNPRLLPSQFRGNLCATNGIIPFMRAQENRTDPVLK